MDDQTDEQTDEQAETSLFSRVRDAIVGQPETVPDTHEARELLKKVKDFRDLTN